MKKTMKTTLCVLTLTVLSTPVFAAETCSVSMMGRVCYEEGSQELTSSHMKGDAVAEAGAKKKVEVADASKAKK